jgi:hypothetical protein
LSYVAKPTKTCCPSCSTWFCHAKYNTPHAFLLAGYSTMLPDNVPPGPFSLALPVALGCKPRTYRTTRSPYALDGFACLAWIASPLAPSPLAWAPSSRTKLHLPAYHGDLPMDPFGQERACMDGSLA